MKHHLIRHLTVTLSPQGESEKRSLLRERKKEISVYNTEHPSKGYHHLIRQGSLDTFPSRGRRSVEERMRSIEERKRSSGKVFDFSALMSFVSRERKKSGKDPSAFFDRYRVFWGSRDLFHKKGPERGAGRSPAEMPPRGAGRSPAETLPPWRGGALRKRCRRGGALRKRCRRGGALRKCRASPLVSR